MSPFKKWIKTNLIFLITVLGIIASVDFFIDPFWCFEHQNSLNNWQKATNERQQKANKIYFSSKAYNTLLVGSSRTTFMEQTDFTDKNVFNFSASGMQPKEYLPYIDFVIHDTKHPIETIIIGADFFGYLTDMSYRLDNASSIVNATKSPYYRWKMLLCYDSINNSVRNVRNTFNPEHQNMTYDRNNIHRLFKKTDTKSNAYEMEKDIEGYAKNEYAGTPDPHFFSTMSRIKKNYPNKNIIIYTTPISEPLFTKMIQMGHYQHYEQWLKDLVAIYGTVYHFMYIHPIAENYHENFIDSNHAYPKTNTLIAKKIQSECKNEPKNFGMMLTRENIKTKLQELRSLNGITK